MKTITKSRFCTLLIIVTLALTGFRPADDIEGFYVNNGKDKIKELNCYTFEDLMVKFPILPEMHGYDWIIIQICKSGSSSKCVEGCGVNYDGPVFRAKYQKLNHGELTFFKKGEQENCLTKGSISHFSLKYTTDDKSIKAGSLKLTIYGQMISGYKEEIVGNSIRKKPT
jgi:hypothetical protein